MVKRWERLVREPVATSHAFWGCWEMSDVYMASIVDVRFVEAGDMLGFGKWVVPSRPVEP